MANSVQLCPYAKLLSDPVCVKGSKSVFSFMCSVQIVVVVLLCYIFHIKQGLITDKREGVSE